MDHRTLKSIKSHSRKLLKAQEFHYKISKLFFFLCPVRRLQYKGFYLEKCNKKDAIPSTFDHHTKEREMKWLIWKMRGFRWHCVPFLFCFSFRSALHVSISVNKFVDFPAPWTRTPDETCTAYTSVWKGVRQQPQIREERLRNVSWESRRGHRSLRHHESQIISIRHTAENEWN